MQANESEASPTCPIERAGNVLGDRWILLIVREASVGVTRFDVFRGRLGIADNILSDRLRRLVNAGVLVKVPYHDGRRTRHEYRLTQAGADLAPALRALGEWGDQHTVAPSKAKPMQVLHTECGGALTIDNRCNTCGTEVPRSQQSWVRPSVSDDPLPLAPAWSA